MFKRRWPYYLSGSAIERVRHSTDILRKSPCGILYMYLDQQQYQIKAILVKPPVFEGCHLCPCNSRIAKGPWWRGPPRSCWPPCTAIYDSTTKCWCRHGRNPCRVWGYVAVCMSIHLCLDTELSGCLAASLPCSSCYWMSQCLNTNGTSFFLASIKWKSWASILTGKCHQIQQENSVL